MSKTASRCLIKHSFTKQLHITHSVINVTLEYPWNSSLDLIHNQDSDICSEKALKKTQYFVL